MHQDLEIRSLPLADCEAALAPHRPQDQDRDIYDRISKHEKLVIVVVTSFCSALAPSSSVGILSAMPELAIYSTSELVINISNALYMVFMGISALI